MLQKDVLLNIFESDSVYEWIDDPNEGPIYIIQQKDKKYLFSQESKKIFLKNFDEHSNINKMDFFIRNMILDFDAHMFKMDFYLDGDIKNHEIDFKDM
jgi:hypothetical protein